MSETTNITKQFLDKVGLDALWNKICSVFASKQELEDVRNSIPVIPGVTETSIISLQMLDDVWEDVIGHENLVIDDSTLNTTKLG